MTGRSRAGSGHRRVGGDWPALVGADQQPRECARVTKGMSARQTRMASAPRAAAMLAPRARDEARPCPGSGLMTMSKLRSVKSLGAAVRCRRGRRRSDARKASDERVGDVRGERLAVERMQQLVAAEARRRRRRRGRRRRCGQARSSAVRAAEISASTESASVPGSRARSMRPMGPRMRAICSAGTPIAARRSQRSRWVFTLPRAPT